MIILTMTDGEITETITSNFNKNYGNNYDDLTLKHAIAGAKIIRDRMIQQALESGGEPTYTATQIRAKLLEMNPQIDESSKFTNPHLYSDVGKWYGELGGVTQG